MSNKKPLKKIIIIASICIVLLFAIYNLVWYRTTYMEYDKYCDGFTYLTGNVYNKKIDDYSLTVKKPDYLRYVGNLAIVSDDSLYTLIVWVKKSGNHEYGVRLVENSITREIYIDKNGQAVDIDEDAKILLKTYEKEILHLIKLAEDIWKIN